MQLPNPAGGHPCFDQQDRALPYGGLCASARGSRSSHPHPSFNLLTPAVTPGSTLALGRACGLQFRKNQPSARAWRFGAVYARARPWGGYA